MGVGNEFVLTDASLGSSSAASTSAGEAPSATGTSGAATSAFELTGSNEGQVSEYIGKRVEITGKNTYPYTLAWNYQTLQPPSITFTVPALKLRMPAP